MKKVLYNYSEEERKEICENVKSILDKNLPTLAYKDVAIWKGCFGGFYLRIGIAASDYKINGICGQLPQIVYLNLDFEDLKLDTAHFGGSGGGSINRKPNLDDPKEKYLYMKGVKIGFRKPKNELKFVYSAIERFCLNWVIALKENRDVLMYTDIVNYDVLLNS